MAPVQTEGAEARKTGNATAAPQAQENAVIPNETTAINTDPAEHTAAEQAVINSSGGINQVLNVESSPQPTPEAPLDPVASAQSDTTISQPSNAVKSEEFST